MTGFLELFGQSLPSLLGGLRVSALLTLVALLFGLPIATVLAFAARAKVAPIRVVAVVVIEIGRGIPALVLLYFMYFGLPDAGLTLPAFLSAAVALAFMVGAYCAEYLRGGFSAVPQGEIEGAQALGMSDFDTMRYVILPQGWRIALPGLMGFAILTFQSTSLAYNVTVRELMSITYSAASQNFQHLFMFLMAGLLYAIVSIPASWLSVLVEKRMAKHL
ncbi:amino acid ABC transporter permease [Brevibacterium samyangense]|uniref:Amino acid ABC transporter permease n=1 Tax=Brevibacterium samyangense TaxID=366888 RepID=A0ABP5EJA7_9MICO